MAEREATIASRVGLHARPAAIFAEAVGDLPVEVTIAAKGEPADEANYEIGRASCRERV